MHISGARTQRLAGIALCLAVITAASALSAQSPAGKSFLWKVHSGSKLVYLAGSVHALSADVYPLSPAFEQAFSASGTLVEEIDLGETEMLAAAPAILAKGMYLDGRRFDSVVSKETAALVNARLKDSGLPVEMFQAMKPWMVMLTLAALDAQKAGLDPALGLDKHFYDRAKAAGKGIIGLETAESQIDRLDAMSSDLQEQLLRSSLSEAETDAQQPEDDRVRVAARRQRLTGKDAARRFQAVSRRLPFAHRRTEPELDSADRHVPVTPTAVPGCCGRSASRRARWAADDAAAQRLQDRTAVISASA